MKQVFDKKLLFVIVIAGIIFFSRNNFIFSHITSFTQYIFSYPLKELYKLRVQVALGAQNNPLQEENRRLIQRFVDFEKVKKDNQALRSQFENSPVKTPSLTMVNIVGFSGSLSRPELFVVDKGSNAGIKNGMTVIYEKNFIGTIIKTTTEYSTVLLPTSKKFTSVGKTPDLSAQGVIKGQADFILLDSVSITDALKKSDIIVTKGDSKDDGQGIPPDLIIGRVTQVNKTENKPFQTALINPLVDFSKLTVLFVIK